MTTTTKLERIEQILNSDAYKSKIGKAPRHLSNQISDDVYTRIAREPKHRKEPSRPRHSRWSIEQY